jgi:lysozyme
MQLGKSGLALIKSFEQLRLTAYKPTPNDVWTCGYGHTKGVKEFDTCSIEKANEWLLQDCGDAIDCVNHDVTAGINQNQFDALVSLVFNIGGGNFKESSLLRKLNEGDFSGAAEQFLRWDRQKGKVLLGLTRRRQAEKALFETKP